MQFDVLVCSPGRKPVKQAYDSNDRRMQYRYDKTFLEWLARNLYEVMVYHNLSVIIGEVRYEILEWRAKFFDLEKDYKFARRFSNQFNGHVKVEQQFYRHGWIYKIEWKGIEYWVTQPNLVRFLTEDLDIHAVALKTDPLKIKRGRNRLKSE